MNFINNGINTILEFRRFNPAAFRLGCAHVHYDVGGIITVCCHLAVRVTNFLTADYKLISLTCKISLNNSLKYI